MPAEALGALYRLAVAAWDAFAVGSLPMDHEELARLSGIPSAHWKDVWPWLAACFAEDSGRLVLPSVAIRARELAELSAIRARSGRKGNAVRRGIPAEIREVRIPYRTPPQASAEQVLSKCEPSPSIWRSERSREESAKSARDVVASLCAGAREAGAAKLGLWRQRQATAMLEKALGEWSRRGISGGFPVSRAGELASGPHSTPARVEAVIEECRQILQRDPGFRVIGRVINGLGLNRSGKVKPSAIPAWIELAWSKREDAELQKLTSMSALEARGRKIADAIDAAEAKHAANTQAKERA
jgi:hypothetical protein